MAPGRRRGTPGALTPEMFDALTAFRKQCDAEHAARRTKRKQQRTSRKINRGRR